jgi:hypothetical protein
MEGNPITVLDTNVLLNLATPVVDGREQAPSGDDPLLSILTVCDVHVPSEILGELIEVSDDDDVLAAAADTVMKASHHFTTHDVGAKIDGELEYGLDSGESHGIWLANEIEADMFVTDEFGSRNFPLVTLELYDTNILLTTPHLLCELAEQDILDKRYTSSVLTYLCELKHWDQQYISRLRNKYLY